MNDNNIPEMKIDDLTSFMKLIDYFQAIKTIPNELGELDTGQYKNQVKEFMFRGQKDSAWKLKSSLERQFNDYGVDFSDGELFEGMCCSVLNEYKTAFRGRISEQYMLTSDDYNDELWAFAQHYDIKSPLLDWTRSFFVALYFAFQEGYGKNDDDRYRAVFCIYQNIAAFSDLNIVSPRIVNGGRINAQQGLFTKGFSKDYDIINEKYQQKIDEMASKVPKLNIDDKTMSRILSNFRRYSSPECEYSNFFSLPISKILINNKLRVDILNFLRSININGLSIFPDIKGLALECDVILENIAYIRKNFGG